MCACCIYSGEATWLSDCHPGPGPEECKHLRWAMGVFRGRPTRACWNALRAGLSRPSNLLYRWAVGVLSGREPLVQDRLFLPGSFARICWKALRAGLSGPLSLHYRWAVGVPSGRDIIAQDSGTARSWSLPAGALEYREPSSGDCVVIVKVPGGSQAISVSRAW